MAKSNLPPKKDRPDILIKLIREMSKAERKALAETLFKDADSDVGIATMLSRDPKYSSEEAEKGLTFIKDRATRQIKIGMLIEGGI